MKWHSMVRTAGACCLLTLAACQTPGTGRAPIAPGVGPVTVHAAIWPNEPLTIYFTDHPQQAESSSTVGINDLLFGNPFAFQFQLNYQFPSNGIEVKDASGPIMLMRARTNSKTRLIASSPTPPYTNTYDWPVPPGSTNVNPAIPSNFMVPRGIPDIGASNYSLELVNTCAGQPTGSAQTCASPSALMLATLSIPRRPALPTHGQTFAYTVTEKGSGTRSAETASTPIKAVFVERGQCNVRSLIVQPATAKAGEIVTADFEATGCHYVKVTADGQVLFEKTASGLDIAVNDSRRFVVPKKNAVTFKLEAMDAAQNRTLPKTATVQVDPCSVNPTGSQCPVNCSANPGDPRCPPNCTATPNIPACASPCPRTTSNPEGNETVWQTTMVCGSAALIPVTISGCTFPDATRAYPPNAGCAYTSTTGQPVGSSDYCPGLTSKSTFNSCLSCKATAAAPPTSVTVTTPDVCTQKEADTAAVESKKPEICLPLYPGICGP